MIDKPIIEALATLGTGITPRFQWNADALSLKSAIDSLAVNRISLPATCEDYEALMAMAMGLHLTKVRTTRSDLPEKQFRRVATLSMQFGASLVDVAMTLKGHERKVAALLNAAQNTNPLANDKPTLQTLLIAATCASKMQESEGMEVQSACQKLLLATGAKQELIAMMAHVMDAVQTAETTQDFAAIAQSLFPDIGEQCCDKEDDSEESAEQQKQVQPPNVSPGNASKEAGQGDSSESAENATETTQPQTLSSGQGAQVRGEQSNFKAKGEESSADGQKTEVGSNAPHLSSVTEERSPRDQELSIDRDNQSIDAPASAESESEQTSDHKPEAKSIPNQDEIVEQQEEVTPTNSKTEQSGLKQTSEEESEDSSTKSQDGTTPDQQEVHDLEKDVQYKSGTGGFNAVSEKTCSNKLQFAKNQFLVSEIVRILQSEDKRSTTIQDRGRKIATSSSLALEETRGYQNLQTIKQSCRQSDCC